MNFFSKISHWFTAWVLCAASGAVMAQSAQTINPGGGMSLDYSDGMELSIGNFGDFQMVVNGIGHLFYSNNKPPNMGYNSVALRLDGPGGKRVYGRHWSNLIAVSQSAVSGSGSSVSPWQVVTVFRPAAAADAGILITVTDRYVFPTYGFTRRIDVSGLPAADTARVYWFFDTQTGGDDSGIGYQVPGSIVGTHNPTTLEKLEFRHNPGVGPLWDHYHSSQYNTPPIYIDSGGDLQNTITTTSVDAGLALQWNAPAGSTSFTAGSDLVYIPASIFARETYTPDSIRIHGKSRMRITLTSVNTVDSAATFQYSLPPGLLVASPANLSNTCTPGGGTVNASGSAITVSGLMLQAKPVGQSAYVCTIELDLTGAQVGSFTPVFQSSDNSVGHAANNLPTLTVAPDVISDAIFVPSIVTLGNGSDLRITLSNRNPTAAQTGQNLNFDSHNPDLVLASPVQISSTCGSTPAVTVSGTRVELSQIHLAAAVSETVPYTCVITLGIAPPPAVNDYYLDFDSTTGVGFLQNWAYLQVVQKATANAQFSPSLVAPGDTTRLVIQLNNNSPTVSSNLNFAYDLTPGIAAASPLNLINTCGGSVNASGQALTATNISLPGNTSQSASCTIAFDVHVDPGSGGGYYADLHSADDSVMPGAQASLTVSNSISGAHMETQLSPTVVGINQEAQLTVTVSSTESTPLTGLFFHYYLHSGLEVVPGSLQTSCPGNPDMALDQYNQLYVNNLSVNAAPAGGRASCTVRFRVRSATPGIFYMDGGTSAGNWYSQAGASQRLLVIPGFAFTPANPSAIPGSSAWSLLATILGLLWLASRRRYFPGSGG